MALIRDVVFKRGLREFEFLKLEAEKFNLKALNNVTIKFDPFGENVKHIRKFAYILHEPQVIAKNFKCVIKTEILCDRSGQTITAEAINGETFFFKCSHLSCLELFQLMNKYITPLAPEETLVTSVKAEKKIKKK